MNCNFKPGDKVICVDNSGYEHLTLYDKLYTISNVYSSSVILEGDNGKYQFYHSRFKLDIKLMRKFKLEQLKNEL